MCVSRDALLTSELTVIADPDESYIYRSSLVELCSQRDGLFVVSSSLGFDRWSLYQRLPNSPTSDILC